ncbi:MAG: MerR family DNA-binding transcriptional regulator [Steroidobacteraceae bacterium]
MTATDGEIGRHTVAAEDREALLTIGELARRAGATPSMLRFYEREGLLDAARRSPAGYRLYSAASERQVLFIRRAQRLGFSLADIRTLLEESGESTPDGQRHGRRRTARGSGTHGAGSTPRLRHLAEQRALDIERRLTELLVLRHELELFLEDLAAQVAHSGDASAGQMYRDLLDHVCGHGPAHTPGSSLERMLARVGCTLATQDGRRILKALRGRHVHVWKEDEGYTVLVAGNDPEVRQALEQLVAAEHGCTAHIDVALEAANEGLLLKVQGANAFLFAQIFLALESSA